MKIDYHPNSIDIPSNVGAFIRDAKESNLFKSNPNKRLSNLASRCDGLVIAWNSCHNDIRANMASQSAILYRLALD